MSTELTVDLTPVHACFGGPDSRLEVKGKVPSVFTTPDTFESLLLGIIDRSDGVRSRSVSSASNVVSSKHAVPDDRSDHSSNA